MTTLFTKPVLRFIAIFLTVLIFSELFIPVSAYALTSGPTQPEFSSFQPVATTNMVNEFTGGFNYNLPVIEIPGPHGSSYPLSLSYQSGASPEDEASWVGYGWNINPGAINRSVRGYPDDDLGVKIEKYMSPGMDITIGVGGRIAPEFSSGKIVGVQGNASLRWNNHKGFGTGIGVDANFAGYGSVGFNVEDGNSSFSAAINPWKCLGLDKGGSKKGKGEESVGDMLERETYKAAISSAFSYASDLLSSRSYPIPMQEFTGVNAIANIGFTGSYSKSPDSPKGTSGGATGSYSSYELHDRKLSAYGYMYSGIAQRKRLEGEEGKENGDCSVSMDYYKERNAPFQKHQKYLPIPFNNPDNFSVSGEGIGGNFRFNHREVGTNIPEYTSSTKAEVGLSGEYTGGTEWGASPLLNLGYTKLNVSSIYDIQVHRANLKKFSTDAAYRDFTIPTSTPSSTPSELNTKDDGVFPRFIGDLGGSVIYDQNLGTLASPTFDKINTPGNFLGSTMNSMNSGKRSGRSSNISYNTIGSMKKHPDFCYTKDIETRKKIIPAPYDPETEENYDDAYNKLNYLPDNAIGEFAVYLPDGKCYVYGLPVLARKEERVNYIGEKENNISDKQATGEYREAPYATKYLLTQILSADYVDRTNDGPTNDDFGGWVSFSYKRCTIHEDPLNTNSKVVDWSDWRIPFSPGTYHFENNNLFDDTDDARSYSQGEKQTYVLEKVETATHVAFFVTNKTNTTYEDNGVSIPVVGSQMERADGYQYGFSNGTHMSYLGTWGNGQGWPTSSSLRAHYQYSDGSNGYYQSGYEIQKDKIAGEGITTVKYSNFSENLERIELYKKGDEHQIKVVRFDYDYSTYADDNGTGPMNCVDFYKYGPKYSNAEKLKYGIIDPCLTNSNALQTYYVLPGGLPNSAMYPTRAGVSSLHNGVVRLGKYGKLTLKKVWFEYGEVLSAKISPYIFEYAYPTGTSADADLNAKYPNYLNYGAGLMTPKFYEGGQDSWGYYSENPIELWYKNHHSRGWLNQNSNNYDPAPYYLKVVKLPSGGEIRIQYEGQDYSYVQDRPAMAMVSFSSIIPGPGLIQNSDAITDNATYILNTSDLGTLTPTELTELRNKIYAQYYEKEKIAFKFLCSYKSGPPFYPEPLSPNESNFELLAEPKENREYVQGYSNVESVNLVGNTIQIKLAASTSPVQIAKEYYTTNISGKENSFKKGNIFDNIQSLLGIAQDQLTLLNSTPNVRVFNKYSYFRIPLVRAKRAGGCRVKRVLMYDPGDQSTENNNEGGAVMYGQEYIYKTLENGKVISSGVATNEPGGMRSENPLVGFLENYIDPGWTAKPIAGKNIDNYEGPLGESILPGPSIGYSRVIVKNIHTGKTTPGFTVHDFYTCKDYPFHGQEDEPQFTDMGSHQTQFPVHSPHPLVSIDMFGESKSQGYLFKINSMNGQPRKVSQYGWELDANFTIADLLSIEKSTPIETVTYEYFEPKDQIPLFYDETRPIENSLNGIEMELSHESNKFEEMRKSGGVEVDFGVGVGPCSDPLMYGPCLNPYFNVGIPKVGMSNIRLECDVLTKIIRYPSILKKVTTKRDGMIHVVENIAFSPYTGQPVVKMVTDEFDGTQPVGGSVQTGTTTYFELPAASKYREMGQKSENDRFALPSTAYKITMIKYYTGSQGSGSPTYVIEINPANSPLYPGDVVMFLGTNDRYLQSMVVVNAPGLPIGSNSANALYELNLLRNEHNGESNPSISVGNAYGEKMVVIRSGKTNQLSAVAGTIALYGKTKEQILNPATTLSNLAASGVLSASATKYSDKWNYTWAWENPESYDLYSNGDTSEIEIGRRGKWRPAETFIYRDQTNSGVGSNKVYGSAGTMTNFTMIDWRIKDNDNNDIVNDPKWLKTNSITHYTKHGEPVEEKDVNNISSAARFAHNDAVPSIIASNSKYLNMYFESYEDSQESYIIQTVSHTGYKSRMLNVNSTSSIELAKIADAGNYIIKLWTTLETAPTIPGSGSMYQVSRNGSWILYEKTITLSSNTSPIVEFNCSNVGPQFVDDIRIQPKDSKSTCYVYDNRNLRLLAQFDDQHFASIFQYNSEGKLIRKIKETTRGVKTIAETNYSTPTIERPKNKAGRGVARYETSTITNTLTTNNSGTGTKTKDIYLKDLLDSHNLKEKIKGMNSLNYQNINDRVNNMQARNYKYKLDTLGSIKFDAINIHATPDQVNAKIIGIDTIKIKSKK